MNKQRNAATQTTLLLPKTHCSYTKHNAATQTTMQLHKTQCSYTKHNAATQNTMQLHKPQCSCTNHNAAAQNTLQHEQRERERARAYHMGSICELATKEQSRESPRVLSPAFSVPKILTDQKLRASFCPTKGTVSVPLERVFFSRVASALGAFYEAACHP